MVLLHYLLILKLQLNLKMDLFQKKNGIFMLLIQKISKRKKIMKVIVHNPKYPSNNQYILFKMQIKMILSPKEVFILQGDQKELHCKVTM